MQLVQLEYFVSVAETLNFTYTAREKYVSQSGVSKQIALLEEELGVKLFLRTTKKVSLTSEGEVFYHEIKPALNLIHGAILKINSQPGNKSLRLGLNEFFDIQKILPGFLKKFTDDHPAATLYSNDYSICDLKSKLFTSELDLIFIMSFELQGNNLIERKALSRSNHRLYYSKQLPLARKQPLALADFENETLIIIEQEESSKGVHIMEMICSKNNLKFNKTLSVNNFASLLTYVEAGLGISILGPSSRLAANESISFLTINDPEFLVGVDAVWLKSGRKQVLQDFIAMIPPTIYL